MTRHRRLSSFVALSLVLAPACTKTEPPAADPAPTSASAPIETKAGTPTSPTVPAPPPPVASTNVALDPLLDLVPMGNTTYVLVRSPKDFIDGYAGIVLGQKSIWTKVLDAKKDPSKPDADYGMRKMLLEFDTVQAALATSGLHLERGLVVVGRDNAVTILAADDVESVPKLMRTLTLKPDEVKTTCKAVADAPGFVACADDAAALAAYVPAKSAATLRTALPGLEIEDANVIGSVDNDGKRVTFAISTTGGVLQIDVRLPTGLEEVARFASPGAATALGLVQAGSSFVWGRLDTAILATQAAEAPPMVGNAVRALSGEFLVAGIGATPGIVVLLGVSDPTPLMGLIPMAALAKDSLPKTLPDGTAMSIAVEEVDDGSGGKLQALRTRFEPKGELAQIRDAMGMQAEVTAFVTKQWAAIALGTGTAVVPDVVRATASAPTSALLAALPAALARDLVDAKASSVTHVELDGLHAPKVREGIETALASAVVDDTLSKEEWLDVAFAVMSPLSSLSMWTAGDRAQPTLRIALRGFGDTSSDEGRAAQAARIEVDAKRADAATAYAALVTSFATSPRVHAYRARAGEGDGTGAAAMVGVLAGIAVPAFQKYIARSKEAAKAMPPSP